MTDLPIILASTSKYRAEMLSRLGIRFEQCAPDIDETPLRDEQPEALVTRLAREKSQAVRKQKPEGVIIAGDQIALCDGEILGKPGDLERARAQLRQLSGKSVRFLSSLMVRSPDDQEYSDTDVTEVVFRSLSDAEIDRYLAAEPALDCAGSFKSEGLGISLCERIRSDDPTGLIGLPLITLRRLLAESGVCLP